MYEGEFAGIYDHIHSSRGKDYRAEAKELERLIRTRRPDASSVLDVACGTGGHLVPLRDLFDRVEGLDPSPDMLAIAGRRVPRATLHRGDMRDFAIGGSFDAIVCMFSSIGYLSTVEELNETLARFVHHLTPGGVIVIEPWVFPEKFTPGYVATDLARVEGRSIARFSHSAREGDTTRMEVHYLDADASGIRHLTDVHRLRLFTEAAYRAAFRQAGCSVEYVADDGFPRGAFVGVSK
ncbi:class I SAM-dependent DNA methyltransferase [Nocardiopsis dassonvillei]|uniref:class I SAM-dependent DNA methyltransferase n=1 Tax=Nocardiopsis dassonvillei TaxID=2014 RepID=UPI003624FDAD